MGPKYSRWLGNFIRSAGRKRSNLSNWPVEGPEEDEVEEVQEDREVEEVKSGWSFDQVFEILNIDKFEQSFLQ